MEDLNQSCEAWHYPDPQAVRFVPWKCEADGKVSLALRCKVPSHFPHPTRRDARGLYLTLGLTATTATQTYKVRSLYQSQSISPPLSLNGFTL